MALFRFVKEENAYHDLQKSIMPIDEENVFFVYRIDLRQALNRWGNKAVRTLYLKPTNQHEDELTIDFIRVGTVRDQFAGALYGVTYYRKQAVMRRAIYVNAPLTLTYRVQLPDGKPRRTMIGVPSFPASRRATSTASSAPHSSPMPIGCKASTALSNAT